MTEPTYKPSQWVAFDQEGEDATSGFGQIIGGRYDGTEWHYTISGSCAHDAGTGELAHQVAQVIQIPQSAIKLTYKGENWFDPARTSVNKSVYSQVDE